MRFSTVFTVLAAATAYAAPVAQPNSDIAELETRQAGIITTILTAAGTTAAQQLTTAAIKAAGNLIKDITNFNSARESFTQATVKDMFNKLPSGMVAAICNNGASKFKDASKVSAVTSAKLTSGPLNVDFDCFYMAAGNTWFNQGDGGFANVAEFSTSACKFDSKAKSLTC